MVLAHERALQKQSEQANKRGHRGHHTGAQRRLTGQEALDAAMTSKWGALFQR